MPGSGRPTDEAEMNTIRPCDSVSDASAARHTSDAPNTFVA